MEATAKYDFKATADDELSFRKGELLKVKEHSHTCCITHIKHSPFKLWAPNMKNIQIVDC